MTYIIKILLCLTIIGCAPTPDRIETKIKTDGQYQYIGTDVGITWKL